jgi:hypothetical protein
MGGLMKVHMRLLCGCVAGVLTVLNAGQDSGVAFGQQSTREWTVPVVMEKATVRGRVVVLETRKEDRQVIENTAVQVWTQPEGMEAEPGGRGKINRRMLHETRTDSQGMFTLPQLDVGEYLMIVGELRIRLLVVPKSEVRKNQEEPKILLILLPKDVLKRQAA